ncbi:type IV secretory protease (plasmid) [Pelobacter propionicus DSM 2379]|uniref:Type IV secretory protease n=1 Tax=Pelobacter propionicus (strain DSM 2379 / NBRC 103807 / OttBd1) TaxID=338966 RepID=A0R7Q0_PELPD|nr:type IV secretory protease [Pelobacter propionicus DSM 2379]
MSITKSLSHRLYWLDKDTAKIKYGDYVLFRHSDVATQFIEQTMIKLVKCDEGDVLTVNEKKELYCNNAFIGRAKDKALNGKKLVNFVWNGPVPPGMFLPMGDHKDSYDGRYYGFLPKSKVLKKAHPVF